jgi:hypothetical protein
VKKQIIFSLRFSDDRVAKFIAESKPPKGISFEGPSEPVVRAAFGMDIVVYLSVHVDLKSTTLAALAVFLAKELVTYLKERKKENATINDQKVKPDKREILLLIKKTLAKQKARDAQGAQNHKNKVKKTAVVKPKKKL